MIPPLDLSRFFEKHPVLETKRLILRTPRTDDAEDIYTYGCDPEVTRYLPWPRHQSIDDSIAYIDKAAKEYAERKQITFVIESKEHAKLIGTCGLHHIEAKHHRLEIGYALTQAFWGFGYMAEVVNELIRFCFEEMGVHRVEGRCQPDNFRSLRVLEKCGMTVEGIHRDNAVLHGKFVSTKTYAIINGN